MRRALVVLSAVILSSGCQVRTEIGLDVRDDGSGTVTVAVGLDDDALARFPGIESELRFEDLAATGWEVAPPEREGDGFTWVRATKGFAGPAEANDVLGELSDPEGPFQEFRLTRDRSFARTSYRFAGTVDFGGGLESFSDDELTGLLDGEPLGEDVPAIEARVGDTLDRVFRFRVAVRLPGDVSSNAPGKLANGAVWEPSLSEGEPVVLEATSRSWRGGTLVWVGVALAAGLILLVLLLIRLASRSGSP